MTTTQIFPLPEIFKILSQLPLIKANFKDFEFLSIFNTKYHVLCFVKNF